MYFGLNLNFDKKKCEFKFDWFESTNRNNRHKLFVDVQNG